MSEPTPQLTHKYGRRPPVGKPRLKLSSFLRAGVVPEHPATADYGPRIAHPGMRLNANYGTCAAATWANSRYLTTAWLTDNPYNPSDDDVVTVYRSQNPGFPDEDRGMVVQLLLEYLHKVGGPDGAKAVAFAEVDTDNVDEVRAAVALFGGVWLGVYVTDTNERQFSQLVPWDYDPRGRDLGGHAVLAPGYDPRLRFFTWDEETEATDAFLQHQLEEAWVVIWPEHLGSRQFLQGVDLAALSEAYRQLTGRTLPIPAPPAPTPPESGGDGSPFRGASAEVVRHIEHSAALAGLTVDGWMERHFVGYFRLKNH